MDRAALSDRSVKGLKTEAVKNFGGAERVPITASLLHDKKIEEETEAVEAQALAKRKKET